MATLLMSIPKVIAGGYPWVVVPIEKREQYMSALEEASVSQNIKPFTKFLALLTKNLSLKIIIKSIS